MKLKDLSTVAQIQIRLEVLEEELSMIKDIVEDKNATDWEKDFYENVKIHLETLIDIYKKRLEIWTKEE